MQNKEIKPSVLTIRRALLSVSDKTNLIELAQALTQTGTELVATGKTAEVLRQAGFPVLPIEELSGNPEAFQGRMKTLSFSICSGILYRRQDAQDEAEILKFKIKPIDCVIVNFYPFETVAALSNDSEDAHLIDSIDIGGPTLVRAAAKNSPHVLVLTTPQQYARVIHELQTLRSVQEKTVKHCAAQAWERVAQYDQSIAHHLGVQKRISLRYGENPHQTSFLDCDVDGSIVWPLTVEERLTPQELSYSNVLDLSAAYSLTSNLMQLCPQSTGVVIVKHHNPCGVSFVPESEPHAQKLALLHAWAGDPLSAFGGVVIFTHPIEDEVATWLKQHFIELVAAPCLTQSSSALAILSEQRKTLKAIQIRRFGELPLESLVVVPGATLYQSVDFGIESDLQSMTQLPWPPEKTLLARFGIGVCGALKSNAIALVREIPKYPNGFQLVGAGQGQPNRVEALKNLAIPRAQKVFDTSADGSLEDCIMISDAFFPFRDTVDVAHQAGIRWIVQPGGSKKDHESIAACNEHGMAMVFTGIRHFRH